MYSAPKTDNVLPTIDVPSGPPRGAAIRSEPAISSSARLLAQMRANPDAVPPWLSNPLHLLGAATHDDRPLRARLADVLQAVGELDRLFTVQLGDMLAWFEAQPTRSQGMDSILSQWTEALFMEARLLIRTRLLTELAGAGVQVRPVVQVDEWQRSWLHRYFMQRVYPLLTPLAVDPGRPFPYISNDSVNLLVELRRPEANRAGMRPERGELLARVKIPPGTPRLIAVPTHAGHQTSSGDRVHGPVLYVSSADLVRFFVHHLFTGMPVRHVYLFRVIRGEVPENGGLSQGRRYRRQEDRPVVRLDVERRMSEPVLDWLLEHLDVPAYGVMRHESLQEWTYLPSLMAHLDQRAQWAVS